MESSALITPHGWPVRECQAGCADERAFHARAVVVALRGEDGAAGCGEVHVPGDDAGAAGEAEVERRIAIGGAGVDFTSREPADELEVG